MEPESFHRQREQQRRKNPDPNTVARKDGKLKLHAQQTSLAPSKHIPHQLPPTRSHELTLLCMPLHHLLAPNSKPPTILKQPCLGKGPKGMKSH